MSGESWIDTNLLVRYFTGDDPVKQTRVRHLLKEVADGSLVLSGPDTVIADAVYVLASPRLYHKTRDEIRSYLTPVLRLPGFAIQNRTALLRALEIYSQTNVGFGDALIVATMEEQDARILYSYDTEFNRFPQVERREPVEKPTTSGDKAPDETL